LHTGRPRCTFEQTRKSYRQFLGGFNHWVVVLIIDATNVIHYLSAAF
jgi:hypothetical protein